MLGSAGQVVGMIDGFFVRLQNDVPRGGLSGFMD